MKDASLKNACLYVISTTNAFNQKTKLWETVEVHCNKIQAEDSVYCPKHVLMVKEHAQDYKRRAEKSAATRARKKALSDALEISPLKAFNPEYDAAHPVKSGYSR